MPTDTTTLKPCPFCGGAAYWDELDIECEGNPTCYVRPRVTGCDTIEEAATAWNTRHEPLNGYWDDPDH